MTDKQLEKLKKLLGLETMKELEALSKEELKEQIFVSENSMATVVKELEDNVEYQRLKDLKAAAEQGKKDVFKRQKAKIAYCLFLIEGE